MKFMLWLVWLSGGFLAASVACLLACVFLAMFSKDMSFWMFWGMGMFDYAARTVLIATIVFVASAMAYGVMRLMRDAG